MKKLIALLLVLTMALALVACGTTNGTPGNTNTPAGETTGATEPDGTTGTTEPAGEETGKVMTYAEYDAAAIDDAVTVECYVQATQGWWFNSEVNHGVITVYAQDADGAYLIYNMQCEEADAPKLTEGTKIRVSGYKADFEGEIEIADATFEFVDGADTFVAEPMDATALLGTKELVTHQNKKVAFKGLTVVASNDEGAAFLYKWNGSGAAGDDLYFKVSDGKGEYTFCVESYLTGDGTAVYDAVEALKVGDVVDMEGFLYWYQGAQPHITSVTPAA